MNSLISDALGILEIVGQNPLKPNRIKSLTVFLLMFAVCIQLVIFIAFNFKDKLTFDAAADLTGMWQDICKVLLIIVNNKQLAELVREIGDFWPAGKFGEVAEGKIKLFYNLTSKLITGFKLCYYGALTCYCCKPLVTQTKSFIFPCHSFSTDLVASPFFEIIYAYQTAAITVTAISVVAFDVLFMTVVFYVLCQFILIKEGYARFKDPLYFEDEKHCLDELAMLARHQDKMLRFVTNMDNCYSILLVVHFLTCTFCVCGGLLILSSGFSGSIVEYLMSTSTAIIYLTSFVGEMFFYCLAGNLIVAEGESVALAVYDTLWWIKTQPRLRRSMVLVILRSHKSVSLTAGGVFSLDLPTFNSIMTKSFSLFTIIRTVFSNPENKV